MRSSAPPTKCREEFNMLNYFPSITPYTTHLVSVDSPHKIYVEECGNPNGIPILFLHGGPGMGCSDDHRRFFDPDIYRVILFDQRGCGRSLPVAEIEANNTQALISDIEIIREKLKIKNWILFGGSWGSILSLAYAITHPDRVNGCILRGIVLCRKSDFSWLFNGGGAKSIFPDHFEGYQKPIPLDKRHDYISAYYDLVTGEDEIARVSAAKAAATWDAHCMTLEPNPEIMEKMQSTQFATTASRIFFHFFKNNCFLSDTFILDNIEKINHLPCFIVHGRYDIITPLENAWTLHKKWPGSHINIVKNAGHAASEPGIIDGLIHATNEMAKIYT